MTIRRRIFALLAAASMLAFSLTATSPALAHDEIIGTSPENGATVAAGAFEVSVTSSEDIMNMPEMAGNQIFVSGPEGSENSTVASLQCIKISGAMASVPVDIDQPGEYTATWQLVSQDGHTNEGSFKFTVTSERGQATFDVVDESEAKRLYCIQFRIEPSDLALTVTSDESERRKATVLQQYKEAGVKPEDVKPSL